MVNLWRKVFTKTNLPSREYVESILLREQAEATRQRLDQAIQKARRKEINGLVDEVIPKKGLEQ